MSDDMKFTPGGITFAPASEITSEDLKAAWVQKEEERSRYASELNAAHAEIAALRADLAKAREEVERLTIEKEMAHGFGYCPRCGSCGVGGCCGHLCSFCKDRHDGEAWDLDGNEVAPHDLGDLSVKVADAVSRAVTAEAEIEALREERVKVIEDAVRLGVSKAERARDEAVAEVKFYQDREAYYAKLLNVTDGGRYRADWAGAVDRLKLARDEAVAEIAERAETEKSLTAMVVEVQSERDEAVAALRDLLDCIECIPPNTRAIARARRALGRTDGEGTT